MLKSIKNSYIITHGFLSVVVVTFQTLFDTSIHKYDRLVTDKRLQTWAGWVFNKINLSWEVNNPHNVQFEKGKPYIVMVNHSSIYDIPLTYIALPSTLSCSIRMLAKKELFKVPFWGKAMRAAEFISIDRQNRSQALKDLEKARKLLESGITLWLAPEGTRSKTGELLPFKKGGFYLALEMGATIIPVGFQGMKDVLPKHSLLIKLNQHAVVNIGKPVDATQYTQATRGDLIREVRNQMLELGGYNQNQTNPVNI